MRVERSTYLFGSCLLCMLFPHKATADCGDGVHEEPVEECDDGNNAPEDGCSPSCGLECTTVGAAATSHTCLHAEHGPFQTTASQEFEPQVFAIHSIDAPHTQYTIQLAGTPGTSRSVVIYFPIARGAYAFYTKGQVPLELRPEGGTSSVALRVEHPISSCTDPSALTWVRVYDLSDENPYWVIWGPTADTEAVVVVESLGSFVQAQYLDEDGDGWGSEENGLWAWCPLPARAPEGGDCDDSNASTHPDAVDLCNGIDDDCNEETQEVCEGADAGTAPDGGHELDAGDDDGSHDAGLQAPSDASLPRDSGAPSDAGTMEEDAAAISPDGGADEPGDAGAFDAGAPVPNAGKGGSNGCAVASSPTPTWPSTGLLLIALLLLGRLRRWRERLVSQ